MFRGDSFFWAPAYPLEFIFDPTGAGDTFAGGFIGFLAKSRNLSSDNYKRALIFGGAMASFCVERFSVERLKDLANEEIRQRFFGFWQMTHFDHQNCGF
jgi:sugar/nucleoside kinase (ribokinase family)